MVVYNYKLQEKYDLAWLEVVLVRYVIFLSFLFYAVGYEFSNFNAFNTLFDVRCSLVAC